MHVDTKQPIEREIVVNTDGNVICKDTKENTRSVTGYK